MKSSLNLKIFLPPPFRTTSGEGAPAIATSGTFCTQLPSGLPGSRPAFLNSSEMYWTLRVSPFEPGARPSNSSEASFFVSARIASALTSGKSARVFWAGGAGGAVVHAAASTKGRRERRRQGVERMPAIYISDYFRVILSHLSFTVLFYPRWIGRRGSPAFSGGLQGFWRRGNIDNV